MNEEIWKPILGYEGYYEACNKGYIRSVDRLVKCKNGVRISPTTILKPSLGQWGYEQVTLRKEGNKKTVRVNRIIAQTFIPNPNNLPQVNHIDGNKTNNCVDNLEWCDASHNMKHCFDNRMSDCRYCVNMDDCQYIVAPDDCEDFEETFEHHWEMMDDIEREEYNSYKTESEDKQ